MLRKWNELPEYMQTEAVRPYYEILRKKKLSLILKRLFDIVVTVIIIGILFPIMVIIAIKVSVIVCVMAGLPVRHHG